MPKNRYFIKATVLRSMHDAGARIVGDDAVAALTDYMEDLAIEMVNQIKRLVRHAGRRKWMVDDIRLAAKMKGLAGSAKRSNQ
jgi:histone H3/H4